ncbi:MAG TPA: cupredoxin domain-containing protein [Pyrinomonadaceae bacterium]|jgi:hypothetical protein
MNIQKIYCCKLTIVLSIASLVFLAGSCGTTQTTRNNENVVQTNVNNDGSAANKSKRAFQVEFKTEPAVIEAGKETSFVFNVKDGSGALVKDLQIVHEKPMHLLIASKDLAEFYHIHPEPQSDGSYRVAHTFPNGGEYRLYADFTPLDKKQVVERIDIKVQGAPRAEIPLQPDAKLEKTVEGLRVIMKPGGEIKAGNELMLNFQAFDAKTDEPATDLENYLGELAHFVIISEDMQDFVHAHPMSNSEHNAVKTASHKADGHNHDVHNTETKPAAVSEVAAHTAFPRSGKYKIWAQFQRRGQIITVPFIVDVKESGEKTGTKAANIPQGAVKVTVSSSGYEPSSISVKKGEAVKLAFYRADAENCGGEIVFPKLNIRKKLPVGETVPVEFTADEAGEIAFACGMDMMKGVISVQ